MLLFILVANLNGNIPYGYTVTTSGIAALGLSVFDLLLLALDTLVYTVSGLPLSRHDSIPWCDPWRTTVWSRS